MNYGKTLVILIRGHGEIPIFEHSKSIGNVNELIKNTTFDYRQYVKNLVTITNATNGEICYASHHENHTVEAYANFLRKEYQRVIDDETNEITSESHIDEFIEYVFGPRHKNPTLMSFNEAYLGRSGGLDIISLDKITINKVYKPEFGIKMETVDGKLVQVKTTKLITGLDIIFSKGFTGIELSIGITHTLKSLNDEMYSANGITKAQILEALKIFNIDNLYLVDLTCSVYTNISITTDADGKSMYLLSRIDDPLLTAEYKKKKLRGGKKQKKVKSKRNRTKNKRKKSFKHKSKK
jgi:hypothetical protein